MRQRLILYIVVGLAGIFLLFRVSTGQMEHPFGAPGLGLWVAGLLTLCVFSFLGGDNPFYKFAEHLFVGVSAAYWMVTGFWTALVPNLFGKLFPGLVADYLIPGLREGGVPPPREWFYVVPLIFGILLLWRLAPKGAWISRWTLAFIVGITAGIRLIGFLGSDFLRQIKETMVPLVVFNGPALDWGGMFNNWVLVVGVISGLCYFYFSKEHTGAFGKISRVGIWTLMITFGAGFGYTVMGRVALLVGRLEFLLIDWLRVASR